MGAIGEIVYQTTSKLGPSDHDMGPSVMMGWDGVEEGGKDLRKRGHGNACYDTEKKKLKIHFPPEKTRMECNIRP